MHSDLLIQSCRKSVVNMDFSIDCVILSYCGVSCQYRQMPLKKMELPLSAFPFPSPALIRCNAGDIIFLIATR